MTDYTSNLVKKKHRHRGIYSGMPYQVAGRLFLPLGTVLTTADRFLMVPIGENQVIKRVTLEVVGDTSTIAGSIGRFQILDANGDPVVVERMGPFGESDTKYTSPATSAALYRAAGQLDGYTETIIATVEKLTGPIYLGIAITTGGTIAADTELFLGAEFDGETSTRDTMGDSDPDNDYLLG
jgi:hypothetical protein